MVSFMPLVDARRIGDSDSVTFAAAQKSTPLTRLHWAWVVAAVSFVAILGAAGFRSVPGVMMNPLHHEFGWSHGVVGLAMSVNMTLFGLTAPFAAALMDRLGVRPVLSAALVLIAAGSALSVTMTASWQLVFLPVVAEVTTRHGWRWASLIVAAAALLVVPLVLVFMRNYPQDIGLTPYGATAVSEPEPVPASSFAAAFDGLRIGARVPAFWLLAASFAICGMTTNGLIGTHFIPAANDHGMPTTVAAGLLATIGILDVAGTVFSGWLTDRVDPRLLLVVYYTGRGLSLLLLPSLLSPQAEPSTWVFVIFYGLDWVATVPPTIVLCRNYFGSRSPVVFGWVFASHQLGAAIAAAGAGLLRDLQGNYNMAFYLAAGLCFIASLLCANVRKAQVSTS